MSADSPRADALRLALLRACMDALQAVEEGAPAEGATLAEEVSDSRWRVRIEVEPADGSGGTGRRKLPPPAEERVPPRLTPLDRLILAKLTHEPCTMAALARRCGHDNDRYFQKRVRRLEEAGHVLHDFHGYRLAR